MDLYILEKGRKLHGRIDFQGLPISVENKTGSRRYWYDPNADEHGSTKMKYPYGYVKGSLGLDGEAVDVFVGPDETSKKVFIVTQMKRPEFKEIDEQKVMLGFDSAKLAKEAYLQHYNTPEFFGSMKEVSLDDFKRKLESNRGKIIKHLFLADSSASIQGGKSTGSHAEYAGGIVSNSESTLEILKSLTSRMLSMVRPRKVEVPGPLPVDSGEETVEVRLMGPEVAQAMYVSRPFEPPIAPTVRINTPFQAASPTSPDFMTSCGGCGYTHKSLNACPRCEQMHSQNRQATPIWRR